MKNHRLAVSVILGTAVISSMCAYADTISAMPYDVEASYVTMTGSENSSTITIVAGSGSSGSSQTVSAPYRVVNSSGTSVSSQPGAAADSSADSGTGTASASSADSVAGSTYANDPKTTLELGFTLVSPAVSRGSFNIAEGSVQLADESWETISYADALRSPYFKLLREETDSTGIGWYVVAAHANRFGDHFTSDGSQPTELWMKKSDCTATASLSLNTSNETRRSIVKNALSLLGKQYSYGSTGPDAFDCSGFVNYVMNSVGISVPRTSTEICQCGTQVGIADLRPGDIVGRSGHVGIYIGDGYFVHSSETTTGVITDRIDMYNAGTPFTNYVNVVGD